MTKNGVKKICALAILGGIFYPVFGGSHSVFADANITMTAKVEEAISVSLSDSSKTITFSDISSSGSFGSTSFSVRTSMNVPRRYQLSMYSSSSATTVTDLTSGSATIPTLTGSESNVNLTNGANWSSRNKWGYALGNSGNLTFSGVGSSSSANILHAYDDSTASTLNMATTNVTLGAMLDMNTAPGTYTTTLNFVALAELTYSYDLVFDANGGTGAPSALSVDNQTSSSYTFTIPSTTPTGSQSFLGWSETRDATSATYSSGDTITVNADQYITLKTLYAVYGDIFNGITTMQAMTPAICAAASENDSTQLMDTRDNKYY